MPATCGIGARSFGGLRNVNVSPMLPGKKPVAPVIVKSMRTLGSWCRAASTSFWIACICWGEEPSFPRKTPVTTLESPVGRKVFGILKKRKIVPARQTTQIAVEIHRRSRNHQSPRPYDPRTRFSTPPMTRSIQVFFEPGPRSWSRRADMSGVRVSDTMPDARTATTIVIANSRKIRPTSPDMKTSGMKTAASEIVIERIVKLISFALLIAASNAFSPRSMRRTVFSRKTMASSTRKPIASVSAISERLSRL